ncbi:MAG: hypothetical protein KDD10_02480 [Phaeodactylibacter sp.]|nr:hypothetical protein [Phaeodactylibacter sp.]MCB9292538.1 hypothetical protein [Lewinellaceae bacterium]MCO6491444.1 hypothetical protein [Phaeodactylibacter sp.]
MTKRSVKRRLIRARIALNQTIQKILDVNRNRKRLSFTNDPTQREKVLNEELRVLNKVARQQASLVEHYESVLSRPDPRVQQPMSPPNRGF